MKRAAVAALALGIAVALSGCTAPTVQPSPPRTSSAAVDLERAVGDLPTTTLQPAQPMRLAKDLIPPTNRWFSGLVFGEDPQPVFPSPLAVTPTSSGVTVSLPTVTATADTIFGSPGPGLPFDLRATGFTVTRYDALTVTTTYADAKGPIADVVLAQGWPYVAVTARRDLTATSSALTAGSAGSWTATAGATSYALRAPDATVAGREVRLPRGKVAVLYAIPTGVDAAMLTTGAKGVVLGGTATGALTAKTASTILRYRTAGGAPTVLAARPGTKPSGARCTADRVLTIYGQSTLCTGTALTTGVPRLAASDALDVSGLGDAERTAIAKQVRLDLAATPAQPADTYAGGKWLHRVAGLLQLAKGVGATKDAATARKLLDDALAQWTEADGCTARADRCFVYDETLRGVVGRAPAYGSEQFNDHHFHYGYFLGAAAVAVADRPALEKTLAPVVDLLAADVASPRTTASFPQRRVFDAYAGHSWASGFSPFADGNNQESTSEAVNAWNGLARWAAVTGNTALEQQATWLLSAEAASAKRDWVQPDLSAFPAFEHAFVALSWGGKRDSATWFSPDPAAKLGIQLIPMPPVATYLGGDAAAIRRNLVEARSARTGLFADYLLMYEAEAGGSRADLQRKADAIPDATIDGATSRAYLDAWIATR